ncbi:hypothetical protein SAMN05518672_102509 [Chitinophaga sp. CF118]|uniref:hypothetical protein n=1 Tax=Chitinophaga sp. CF118 TaxID=1884367 RepID=UPI0008EA65CE|nr:hypothetical protein [Chitinophaga sp. CF118]SFD58634.1 hypothetical protein SAMN05518672_102509 [Chitinophaga sp. CF118]
MFHKIGLSINQLFFYTRINNPLLPGQYQLINADGYIDTKGRETNVKLGYYDQYVVN